MRKPCHYDQSGTIDRGARRNHVSGPRMDDFIHNRVAQGARGIQIRPDWKDEQSELQRWNQAGSVGNTGTHHADSSRMLLSPLILIPAPEKIGIIVNYNSIF